MDFYGYYIRIKNVSRPFPESGQLMMGIDPWSGMHFTMFGADNARPFNDAEGQLEPKEMAITGTLFTGEDRGIAGLCMRRHVCERLGAAGAICDFKTAESMRIRRTMEDCDDPVDYITVMFPPSDLRPVREGLSIDMRPINKRLFMMACSLEAAVRLSARFLKRTVIPGTDIPLVWMKSIQLKLSSAVGMPHEDPKRCCTAGLFPISRRLRWRLGEQAFGSRIEVISYIIMLMKGTLHSDY